MYELIQMYEMLNIVFFKGNLPSVDIVEYNNENGYCVGFFDTETVCIYLNMSKIDSTEMLIGTLAHEMIHVWQFITGDCSGNGEDNWHNKKFNKKAKTIKNVLDVDIV